MDGGFWPNSFWMVTKNRGMKTRSMNVAESIPPVTAVPIAFTSYAGMDIGRDNGLVVDREYESDAPFAFTGGIYPSTFFLATGFHGFHVIVGTCFLIVCLIRAMRGDFTPRRHFGFEAAAWYWHFVDVVWLFLFICIYWWGAGEIAEH